MSSQEARLFILVTESPRCAELGIGIAPAPRFGLQVSHRGLVVGVWSERDGVLGFRNLASWQIRNTAATPGDAMAATIAMAEREDWLG